MTPVSRVSRRETRAATPRGRPSTRVTANPISASETPSRAASAGTRRSAGDACDLGVHPPPARCAAAADRARESAADEHVAADETFRHTRFSRALPGTARVRFGVEVVRRSFAAPPRRFAAGASRRRRERRRRETHRARIRGCAWSPSSARATRAGSRRCRTRVRRRLAVLGGGGGVAPARGVGHGVGARDEGLPHQTQGTQDDKRHRFAALLRPESCAALAGLTGGSAPRGGRAGRGDVRERRAHRAAVARRARRRRPRARDAAAPAKKSSRSARRAPIDIRSAAAASIAIRTSRGSVAPPASAAAGGRRAACDGSKDAGAVRRRRGGRRRAPLVRGVAPAHLRAARLRRALEEFQRRA